MLTSSNVFPFILIWISILSTLVSRYQIAALLASLSIISSLYLDLIEPRALIPITLITLAMAFTILYHRSDNRFATYLFWIFLTTTIVISTAVGFHAFEGFNNLLIVDKAIVSSDSIPYTLYWNYDKAFVAFCLILLFKSIAQQTHMGFHKLTPSIFALLVTIALTLTLAGILELIEWDPKVPDFFHLWVLSNLFITSAAEEAFFRGAIQYQLQQLLTTKIPYASILSISVAGILFGIAHFAMGSQYVLVAVLAGIGYGLIFHFTGRLEASIVSHFLLNTVHIIFFSYPMLNQV
jgi:membrane protease YdiL (CAAX protease family)